MQGVDYTYTLQGWLKGLNHPGVDPGNDGAATGLTASAKDAFGMALGYYQGDFLTQNSAWQNGSSSVLQPQYSLYNGNIAAWTSKTRDDVATLRAAPSEGPVGEHYRYDQLNRLTSSATTRFALGGGSPTATQDYATNYSYDANGNLLTLNRNGNASVTNQQLAMDQLSYAYPLNAQGQLRSNRLLRVNDPTPNQAYYDDIKSYADTARQYVYDAIGNLVSDNTGGVSKTISWNVYGKISQVQQSNGVLVQYRYDAQGQRIRKRFSSNNGQNWRHVYYVRDAQGNVLAVYEQTEAPNPRSGFNQPATILGGLVLTEQPLYGSARLGQRQLTLALTRGTNADQASAGTYQRLVGQKRYELTDHLGNVRALVSDAKLTDVAGTFKPDLKAYYNYYPFGMLQPNRNGPGTRSLVGGYRYGFNGKEMDNNGELGLTSYDYGFRIYNPGVAKFLSVDPLTESYPMLTPYQFASNRPIQMIDLDGLEAVLPAPPMIMPLPMTGPMVSPAVSPGGAQRPSSIYAVWAANRRKVREQHPMSYPLGGFTFMDEPIEYGIYNLTWGKVYNYGLNIPLNHSTIYTDDPSSLSDDYLEEVRRLSEAGVELSAQDRSYLNEAYSRLVNHAPVLNPHPNGIYEQGSNHGAKDTDIKSKAPLDGQAALDNSYQIGENTQRRVGVSNGEIVIFDPHLGDTFHGHVRTWEQLLQDGKASQAIRNTLLRENLVNMKGKLQ